MITMPCTRADCAIAGYVGRTSLVFCGGLMLPPTRTGAAGGGGGGGASGSPPTTPPTTPPGTPPSTPARSKLVSTGSALISLGGSVGAALGFTTSTGFTSAGFGGGG